MTNGQPLTVYLWDTFSLNFPDFGTVLASASGVTANVDTGVFNDYAIPPTVVPAGDNFFVGVIMPLSTGQRPAALDTTTSMGGSCLDARHHA